MSVAAGRLGFEIYADDNASSKLTKTGTTMRKLASDVEIAQLRVEKANRAAGKAVEKYGKDSIEARTATARLAQAQIGAERAAEKLAAAERLVGKETDSTANKTGKFREALKHVATTMAGSLGAQAVTAGLSKFRQFASDSVEAASSLGESMNAVQKVFGSSAREITDWGASSAASFGLSQRAFQEFATPLGASLKNAGLSMQDTAKWTIDLTQRAADMASVFNTDVSDALEAIQAGLRGEADPLERYGVGLSAAAVQAEALAQSHKSAASELTNTELATARLSIIMKQTASVEGDFQQTSDGFANAQRKANAELENAKAKLGAGLLPIMAKLTSVLATVVSGFASLPKPVQAVAIAAVAVGAAVTVLLPKIVAAKAALAQMGVTATGLKSKLGGVAGGFARLTAVLAAAQAAGAAFSTDSGAKGVDTTTKALRELVLTGNDTSGTLEKLNFDLHNIGVSSSARNFGAFIEQLTGNMAGLAGDTAISAVNERIAALDSAMANLVSSGNAEEAVAMFDYLAKRAADQGTSIETLKDALPQYENAIDAASAATREHAQSSEDAAKAQEREKAALDALNEALDANRNATLILSGGELGYRAAVNAVTESLKENGRTLDLNTEKGQANQRSMDDLSRSSLEYLSSLRAGNAGGKAFNAGLIETKNRLILAQIAFGKSSAEAIAYANKIIRIPPVAMTRVELVGLGVVLNGFNTLEHRIAQVNGRRIYIPVYAGAANVREGGTRAHGGIIPGPPSTSDNVPMWLSTGEYVVNARQTSRYLPTLNAINAGRLASGGLVGVSPGSSRGPVITLRSDGGSYGDFLLNEIRKLARVNGGNVQLAFGRN